MIFLFVFLVRPKVILEKRHYVDRDGNASLHCQVEGSPLPTISWTPCNPEENVCDRRLLNISRVQSERSNYTCTANNSLDEDSASTSLSKLTLVVCTIDLSPKWRPKNCTKLKLKTYTSTRKSAFTFN